MSSSSVSCPYGRIGLRLALVGLVAVSMVSAREAAAQVAPTGDFYGGRATDTGFSGKVNAAGGYASAVPLDLPTPRGGIPLPVEVSSGGHDVGAAGVGWDVPLSFLRVDSSITKRKPINAPNAPVQGRTRVSLSIAGQSITLVPKGGSWVSQQDGALYTAIANNGAWFVNDGAGHRYTFTEPVGHTGTGLWLLTQVAGAGGTADALRQFRMTTSDLLGAHGDLGPHVHFEALDASGRVVENLHVPLLP